MVLNAILAVLALLSLALTLWQWLAARRFPLHQRLALPPQPEAPALTLLKPLKGCDAYTEDCLRSWFAQQYPGPVQILFGVAAAADPVVPLVHKLMREFPASDVQLVVCGPLLGANAKVSQLTELERLAKHDLLVISDADVHVPPDLLANIFTPLLEPASPSQPYPCSGKWGPRPPRASPPGALAGWLWRARSLRTVCCPSHAPVWQARAPTTAPGAGALPCNGIVTAQRTAAGAEERDCGLVCCLYRLANPTTLAMQWEAIAINADFWSQVLQSQSLKPIDFALGAVMATPRSRLEEIGGFKALADCLADDYQLGNRIARRGHTIALSPVVVECWSAPMGWTAVWRHQLRWARTIRVCQPVPYFFSILSNATLWPLLWLAAKPAPSVFAFALLCCLNRVLTALDLQRRLNRTPDPGGQPAHASPPAPWHYAWLVPVKDLVQAAVWLLAFLGNRIEWRGQKLRLRPDGTLERLETAR